MKHFLLTRTKAQWLAAGAWTLSILALFGIGLLEWYLLLFYVGLFIVAATLSADRDT